MKKAKQLAVVAVFIGSMFIGAPQASAIVRCVNQPLNLTWSSANVNTATQTIHGNGSLTACSFTPFANQPGGPLSVNLSSGTCTATIWVTDNATGNTLVSGTDSVTIDTTHVGDPGTQTCIVQTTPVNGACSATHYGCNAGTSVSNVAGATAWTWSCQGANGGSTAQCSEAMPTGLVNGACGGANGVSYPYGSTGYGGNAQCSAGNSTNTAFPAPGSTVTWNCTGLNGGATSPQCSASQAPQPGALAIDMWWTPASIASGGYSTIQSNIDFLASN